MVARRAVRPASAVIRVVMGVGHGMRLIAITLRSMRTLMQSSCINWIAVIMYRLGAHSRDAPRQRRFSLQAEHNACKNKVSPELGQRHQHEEHAEWLAHHTSHNGERIAHQGQPTQQ